MSQRVTVQSALSFAMFACATGQVVSCIGETIRLPACSIAMPRFKLDFATVLNQIELLLPKERNALRLLTLLSPNSQVGMVVGILVTEV